MKVTATIIAKKSQELRFNPKTDKSFALIADVATVDHSIRLAQTELAASHRDYEQSDLQSRRQRLVMAGQMILLALAMMDE
jgi:hypothetical protein